MGQCKAKEGEGRQQCKVSGAVGLQGKTRAGVWGEGGCKGRGGCKEGHGRMQERIVCWSESEVETHAVVDAVVFGWWSI